MQSFFNKKKYGLRKNGFTLFEMVVYVAVITVIFVMVIETVLLVSTTWGHARAKRNLITQGGSVMERMLREVRLADSINVPASTFSTSTGVLVLNTIVSPSDTTPVTRQFFVATSSLVMRENSVDTFLSDDISVTGLVFYQVANSDTSQAVQITLTVEGGAGRFVQSENLYGTAVLRRSY